MIGLNIDVSLFACFSLANWRRLTCLSDQWEAATLWLEGSPAARERLSVSLPLHSLPWPPSPSRSRSPLLSLVSGSGSASRCPDRSRRTGGTPQTSTATEASPFWWPERSHAELGSPSRSGRLRSGQRRAGLHRWRLRKQDRGPRAGPGGVFRTLVRGFCVFLTVLILNVTQKLETSLVSDVSAEKRRSESEGCFNFPF